MTVRVQIVIFWLQHYTVLGTDNNILEEHTTYTLRVERDFIPEDGGSIFLWNGAVHLQEYMVSQSRNSHK